ncbi:hypothetical protein JVU11DRAFT_10435 [Chiua virens]|nr:hypothetical protein JVU11DRAFT_10435 [Chiua virens]
MCKLLDHIVKLITSMSSRRLGRADDSSLRFRESRGIPAPLPPVPRHSPRETMGSSRTPDMSEVSARGSATSPTSQLRNESVHASNRSDPQLPRDTQESARVERGSTETRKRAATPTSKDQESVYSKEAEGTQSRDARYPACDALSIVEGGTKTYITLHWRVLKTRSSVRPHHQVSNTFSRQSRERSTISNTSFERRARNTKRSWTRIRSSRQASEEREKKLSTTRHERQAALEQMKEVQNAHAALKQQFDELAKKFNLVRYELKAALEQKQKVEEECTDFAQKYEAQKNEHHALSNKHQSLKAALEQRTSELQGVQKFLSTADTFSGSEVVNTLRRLNEEVNQNATFMAEWSVENLAFETPNADQAKTQTGTVEPTRASSVLGTGLLELLGTRKNQDNPILVEMAFRAYLISELYFVASPWSTGQEEQSHNQYIDAIYQRMREAEGQAVSGNWRALTHAYTLPACISDPELAQTFVTTIVSGLSDILLAAGCTTSKEDITAALWSKFAERIHHFVSLAGQVNKIIGAGVISEDFEVLVVWPGVVFEEKTMENADDNGERVHKAEEHQPEETVLCATELGLMQRMRVGGSGGDKTKPTELIVIKPKVTLTSVLNELVE